MSEPVFTSRQQLKNYYCYQRALLRKRWPWYFRFPFFRSLKFNEEIFQSCFIGLCSKLIHADGHRPFEELSTFEEFLDETLKLSKNQKVHYLQELQRERRSPNSFEFYAQRYFRLFRHDEAMLENMFDLLTSIAHSDGTLHDRESTLLETAKQVFRISSQIESEVRQRQQVISQLRLKMLGKTSSEQRSPEQPHSKQEPRQGEKAKERTEKVSEPTGDANAEANVYSILGCSAKDSEQHIKRHYRSLVMRYHPDRLQGAGLPKELWLSANERFQEIQLAYEQIKLWRKFK